jgi:Cache domain
MFVYSIIIGIVLFLGISSILPTLAVNQTTLLSNQDKSVVASSNRTDNKLIVLSDLIENRIGKAAAILELTSRLPEMRGPPRLELFSPASKGIPENADLAKRQTGREILSKYPEEFVSFLFLTPNGTVYLLEPFTRQQNLSTYDLSHRDYYKGVIQTKHTFLGNVITSASSGRNQIQLAVPVYSLGDSNQTSLIGVLSSGLNFKTFNEILQSLNLSSNERIVLLDSNGTKIADSDTKQISSLHKSNIGDASFRKLQSFNNAVKGETGTVQEMVNGSNTEIKYKPVKAIQNNWVLLLFQSSGASAVPANSNLGHADNTTMSIQSNETMPNSNISNKSSSLNITMPEQLPPQSINGSKVPKI